MQDIPPHFIAFVVFIFGLLIGSFLNVVIYRLPLGQSIVFPGSRCPACDAEISWYDNIPVISYALLLRGRCRNCRTSISAIYPAVELLVACLYLALFIVHKDQVVGGSWLPLIADLVFVSLIVPLVFIDLRYKLLPNAITYPGLIVLIVLRALAPDPWILAHTPKPFGLAAAPVWAVSLFGSLLGALVGGGSLWLVREAYYRLRHVEGMGLGDVKMMLMVGAFLGWQLTLLTIFVGSLLGSLVGVLLILRGGSMKMQIPFGVFLGPAAIIALFAGQQFIVWYVGLYR
ncbi:MAG TPA: prepilin peptidase [Blastocatellia bacterium]|nr:prepilin peptidase [Blastocatellia bacterium]